MKKQLITLSLAVLVTISSAFAGNKEGVSEKAVRSFNKEFAQAKNVQWDINRNLQKATFELNGQFMFAYYNNDGELLGVSRNLTTTQLPIRLSSSLKQHYSNYWITDLFEMASNNESSYYITIENADSTSVLRAIGSGDWQLYRKVKKEAL
jgi:hypothetical protein